MSGKKLSSVENSSAKLWKSAKGIIGWGDSWSSTRLLEDGKFISSPSGLVTSLNNYFIKKVRKLRESIPVAEIYPLSSLRETMLNRQSSSNIKLVIEQEVLKIIASLNNTSSTGVDSIDAQTIKLVKHKIVGAVTRIINLNIKTSTFPSIYSHSQIFLLKKSLPSMIWKLLPIVEAYSRKNSRKGSV